MGSYERLSVIWKSDQTVKIKCSIFQAAVVSILLYGCTTWTLTKRIEKKFDGNYTRILQVILSKSWRQHPTKQQLYSHLPPITKTIQVRRTRHVGPCWRSGDELISDILLWTCGEEKKFVFWFGAQFNSTLNFTQSGWLILFIPDLHFRPSNLVSCQTQSLWLENADQCRRHTGRSSIAMLFGWTMPPSADTSLWL